MAKKSKSTKLQTESLQNKRVIFAVLIACLGLFLLFAFSSYFFSWKYDQSILNSFDDRSIEANNLLGKIGATLSHILIFKGFGLGAYVFPLLLMI